MSAPRAGGHVALVTGASRGVGRGIALGLGEAGWTVYLSSRGPDDPDSDLGRTAADVADRGGVGHPVICDHRDDREVESLVDRCVGEQGRLDLLVNNVWAGPPIDMTRPQRFWERPMSDWDTLVDVGLRAHVVAASAAARHMAPREAGLIVNVSSAGARAYLHSVLYGISKAGLDKMTHDMAFELAPFGVTVLSLWPGLVQTPALVASGIEAIAGVRVADGEPPELQGRVVAALAADPDVRTRSGTAVLTAEMASHYGLVDRPLANPRDQFGGPLHGTVTSAGRE